MSRRGWIGTAIVAVLVVAIVLTAVRVLQAAPQTSLALAGDVADTVYTVSAPAISYPVPDYSVGIPTSSTSSATPGGSSKPASSSSASASMQTTISGEIVRMYVSAGDRVTAGQAVAQLDTTRLRLGVKQAEATARRARTQVDVLSSAISTVTENQNKLATGRAKLASAQAALDKAKAALATAQRQFAAQKADALAKRAQAVQARAMLQAQLAVLLQQPNPNLQLVAQLKAQIAGLTRGIQAIDKGLATGAVKLAQGEAKLAQGQAQITTGKSQLASAASALAKAKKQLKNARSTLGILATAQDLGVRLAEIKLSQATIHSAYSGIVTEARNAGVVAMVGSPIVRIRPSGPTLVYTYLTPDQLPIVRLGAPATVDFDSNTQGQLRGKVTRFDDASAFPPTSFPTSVVHMTGAVRVTVALDGDGWAPPGTPVDVTVDTTNAK